MIFTKLLYRKTLQLKYSMNCITMHYLIPEDPQRYFFSVRNRHCICWKRREIGIWAAICGVLSQFCFWPPYSVCMYSFVPETREMVSTDQQRVFIWVATCWRRRICSSISLNTVEAKQWEEAKEKKISGREGHFNIFSVFPVVWLWVPKFSLLRRRERSPLTGTCFRIPLQCFVLRYNMVRKAGRQNGSLHHLTVTSSGFN